MATSLTIRMDPDIERALASLTADGRSRSEAVRAAILDAERAARRAEMRAEAERLRNDPVDRAEIAAIRAILDADRAW